MDVIHNKAQVVNLGPTLVFALTLALFPRLIDFPVESALAAGLVDLVGRLTLDAEVSEVRTGWNEKMASSCGLY